jgi:N-acetyltransferase
MVRLAIPILTGQWVQLEPLAEAHRHSLRLAADYEAIWQHTLSVARGPEFDVWFEAALARQQSGEATAFAVRRLADDRLVGSTSYLDFNEQHRRIEIGATWYSPDSMGTAVNPECKYLLLQHAFEAIGVNRVALVTDVRNTRSQAAIAKLGAVREGILRGHMITQGGRVRDSVLYSIIASEWPNVRAGLIARLTRR